jgi:hypothetical protein
MSTLLEVTTKAIVSIPPLLSTLVIPAIKPSLRPKPIAKRQTLYTL